MRLILEGQIDQNAIDATSLDLVLCSSGYEKRASHLARKLGQLCQPARKVAAGFLDRAVLSRSNNDRTFHELGYDIIPCDGGSSDALVSILDRAIQDCGKSELRVVIDYSCMTRAWYGGVVRYLRESRASGSRLEVIFCYSPSQFSAPPKAVAPNEVMGPLAGFSSLRLPKTDTSLVIGLGYERERAMGVYQYVEAASSYLFYADPVYDGRFTTVVRENNKELLSVIKPDRVIRYPLGDLQASSGLLTSLCRSLVSTNRVIIAPLGPKPFALLCLLLSVRMPGCDVWRVSPGTRDEPVDRKPAGTILAYRTVWTAEPDV